MITESIDNKTVELIEEFSGATEGLALPIRDWYRLFPQSFFRVAPAVLNRERDILILRLMLEDNVPTGLKASLRFPRTALRAPLKTAAE